MVSTSFVMLYADSNYRTYELSILVGNHQWTTQKMVRADEGENAIHAEMLEHAFANLVLTLRKELKLGETNGNCNDNPRSTSSQEDYRRDHTEAAYILGNKHGCQCCRCSTID